MYAYGKSCQVWSFPEQGYLGAPHLFGNLGLAKVQGHGFGMAFHPNWQETPIGYLTYVTRH